MKKSINILLFLFVVCTLFANISFAQSIAGDPMPGVPVGLDGDPGSIIARTTTNQKGMFSFKLPVGKFKITLLYDQIKKAVSSIDKSNASNKDAYVFTLSLDEKSKGLLVSCKEKSMNKPFLLTKESGTVTVHWVEPSSTGGAVITGYLTYTRVKDLMTR